MNSILAWLHKVITSFHDRLAALEGRAGVSTPPLPVHPEVQTAADAHAAQGVPAVAASLIDYAKYAEDTPYTIEILRFPGGLPVGWDWAEWTKVSGKPDPTVVAPSATDSGGARNSFVPLPDFGHAYDHGRWTFQPGVAISVPVTAPSAGDFHFACSGSGGVPGGDSSVRITLTITDAAGNTVGSGSDNPPYASFTAKAAGEVFTLTMIAPAATVEDVTFQPGVA